GGAQHHRAGAQRRRRRRHALTGRHGLRLRRPRGGVPQAGPGLARRQRARRAPRPELRRHARRPRRGGAPARLAEADVGGGVRRHGLAPRVRRAGRVDPRAARPLRGAGARRGAAVRQPRRAVDARADVDGLRDARPAAALPASNPDGGRDLVSGVLRAERPLRQLTGEAEFNEVFFENVRVPVANVVGRVNEGWGVAITTLAYERDLLTFIRHVSLRNALQRLIALARRTGSAADPVIRQEIAGLAIGEQCLRLNGYRSLTKILRGGAPG